MLRDNDGPEPDSETDRKRLDSRRSLEYYVTEELRTSVSHDTPRLLETMFPVPDAVVDEVYASVSRFNRHYDMSKKNKRWKAYPLAPLAGEEHMLRAPFTQLVAIVTRSLPRGWKTNGLQWHINDIPPASRDPCLPDIKPDIVATLGVPSEGGSSVIPWSRIFLPVTIKTQTMDSGGSAILELLKCMRLIFHEAVDRCFVLGLVLAYSDVTVYLAHRGGVVESRTFNIHDDPKTFIRVIIGISSSSIDRLGLDTSLRVISPNQTYSGRTLRSTTSRFSYEVKWDPGVIGHYWLLEMPGPDAKAGYGIMDNTKKETFVLFECITRSSGNVVRSSSTRAWKAWLVEEMYLPPRKRRLFVVKDSWHDCKSRLEGDIYKLVGSTQGIATMRSYSVVGIDGEDDTTCSRIQRNLLTKSKPRRIDGPQGDAHTPTMFPCGPKHTAQWLIDNNYLPTPDQPDCAPQCKVHTRLVMETYGWSVKFAVSPLELVRVMRDVVEGYRMAYRRGVMHSYMSIEDILITGRTEEGWRGALIDFGHAQILGRPVVAVTHGEQTATRPFVSAELLLEAPYFSIDNRAQHPGEKQKEAPQHSFHHDLESILWIVLWICLCSSGGGIRRPALYDSQHADHKELSWAVTTLFESLDSSVLGRTKWAAIVVEGFFARFINSVDDFYSVLKPLLWALWTILREGYRLHLFAVDATFDGFRDAFDDAERELLTNPHVLSDAQKANVEQELARRAKDCEGWTHASVRPVDSEATP